MLGVDGVVEVANVGGGEFAGEIGQRRASWGKRASVIGGRWGQRRGRE